MVNWDSTFDFLSVRDFFKMISRLDIVVGCALNFEYFNSRKRCPNFSAFLLFITINMVRWQNIASQRAWFSFLFRDPLHSRDMPGFD